MEKKQGKSLSQQLSPNQVSVQKVVECPENTLMEKPSLIIPATSDPSPIKDVISPQIWEYVVKLEGFIGNHEESSIPYLGLIVFAQGESFSVPNLHHHLLSNEIFCTCSFFTPKPPVFLLNVTLSHFTKCSLLFSSKSPNKNCL